MKKLLLLFMLGCNSINNSNTGIVSNILPPTTPYYKLQDATLELYCSEDMVYIERDDKRFCIDRFEYPNVVGEKPVYGIDAYAAKGLCEDIGKRLCLYDEWYDSCIGKEKLRYSYGSSYNGSYCNDHASGWQDPKWFLMGTDKWMDWTDRLSKAEAIGSRPQCKSDEGVYDLLGNVREWTSSPETRYGYTIPASYFYGDMMNNLSCTYKITNHSADFATYEAGMRCCKDINDPN